jgi:hypothetical protein
VVGGVLSRFNDLTCNIKQRNLWHTPWASARPSCPLHSRNLALITWPQHRSLLVTITRLIRGFPIIFLVNSYPCVYAKHCQMTFVTLWPDVVTSHHEAGTHIDERSIQRNIGWNLCKVRILLQWLFILYPMWLHRLVKIRRLCRYPPRL